jgi:hypothetical protein
MPPKSVALLFNVKRPQQVGALRLKSDPLRSFNIKKQSNGLGRHPRVLSLKERSRVKTL